MSLEGGAALSYGLEEGCRGFCGGGLSWCLVPWGCRGVGEREWVVRMANVPEDTTRGVVGWLVFSPCLATGRGIRR